MVGAAPAPLSETLRTPLGVGMALYLLIGFLVAGFIAVRGRRHLLVDKGDDFWKGLRILQSVLLLFPIAFMIELALWPLVLLFLWAYQDDDDDVI